VSAAAEHDEAADLGAQEQAPPSQGDAAEQAPPSQGDAAEPAGEEDPGNEAELEGATDRPAGMGQAIAGERQPAAPGPDQGASADGADGVQEREADDASEDPLAGAVRDRDGYLELARRTKADFDNYRKRAAREAATAGERAKAGLVRELLSVVDNLERALASLADGEQTLAEGVRLVHAELIGVLERSGVESFAPTGEPFDPTLHEALMTRVEHESESGVVVEVLEKGYRLNDAILRPARVVVSA